MSLPLMANNYGEISRSVPRTTNMGTTLKRCSQSRHEAYCSLEAPHGPRMVRVDRISDFVDLHRGHSATSTLILTMSKALAEFGLWSLILFYPLLLLFVFEPSAAISSQTMPATACCCVGVNTTGQARSHDSILVEFLWQSCMAGSGAS